MSSKINKKTKRKKEEKKRGTRGAQVKSIESRSWPPPVIRGDFWAVQNRAFFKHWPKMGSKGASGSILGGICEDFGRIWEGFGQNFFHVGLHLKGFGQRYGRIWANLEKTGAASLNRTPALIREASQCAGVLSHRVLNRTLK